nr:unnamed protein product [Digitaria exilis]
MRGHARSSAVAPQQRAERRDHAGADGRIPRKAGWGCGGARGGAAWPDWLARLRGGLCLLRPLALVSWLAGWLAPLRYASSFWLAAAAPRCAGVVLRINQ